MRLILSLALLLPAAAVAQQARPLSVADSTLVGRVLLAEDRRDSTDAALARALQHPDARLRTLARRAIARIRDPKFVSRDSLPALPPPRTWPEPSWRLRYRALAPRRADCAVLGAALGDSVWHVRLRAADLLQAPCASDEGIVRTLRAWVDSMPADVNRRRTGEVSWHAAAHAVVALARLRPDEARSRIQALSSHPRWQLRLYATRAAGVLADTARLRAAARDSNDNVKEAAVDALSFVGSSLSTPHASSRSTRAVVRKAQPASTIH